MEGREGKESAPLDLNPGDATARHYYAGIINPLMAAAITGASI